MKIFKSFINRIKYSRLVFLLRCLIFGYTNTKLKDMNKKSELEILLKELNRQRIILKNNKNQDNRTEISKLIKRIDVIETEISLIEKNQHKYLVMYKSNNLEHNFFHYSIINTKINSDNDDIFSEKYTDILNEIEFEVFCRNNEYSDLKIYLQK